MAAPLKGEDLRDAKDFLVGAIAEQAKDLGWMPKPEIHERAVEPIIRRVEVDAEDEARRSVLGPTALAALEPAPPPPGPPARAGWERIPEEAAGAVLIDPKTGEVVQVVRFDEPEAPEIRHTAVRRARFRKLRELPEWRARVLAIVDDPTATLEQKANRYEAIYQDSIRFFGDPEKPRPRKATIFSKPKRRRG